MTPELQARIDAHVWVTPLSVREGQDELGAPEWCVFDADKRPVFRCWDEVIAHAAVDVIQGMVEITVQAKAIRERGVPRVTVVFARHQQHFMVWLSKRDPSTVRAIYATELTQLVGLDHPQTDVVLLPGYQDSEAWWLHGRKFENWLGQHAAFGGPAPREEEL